MGVTNSGDPNSGILFFMITEIEILNTSHSSIKCLSIKKKTDLNVHRYVLSTSIYYIGACSCVCVCVYVPFPVVETSLITDQKKENKSLMYLEVFTLNYFAIFSVTAKESAT